MKSIKLKVTKSITKSFAVKSLIKAKVDDEGNIYTGSGKGKIWLSRGVCGEIFCDASGAVAATFVELKTKTLKCVGHDHGNGVKKSFKKDKRYQVDEMRPVGTVAGYIFDDEGARWGLYREDVGFSTLDGSLFESKYS